MITVFTLSTGRAGTSFLTGLFAANVKNCVALHEPAPRMNAEVIDWYDAKRHDLIAEAFAPKRELIRQLALAEVPVYLESSHLFLKSFCDVAVRHYPYMKLVYLIRDPLEVAASYVYREERKPGYQDAYLLRRSLVFAEFQSYQLSDYQRHLVAWILMQNRAVIFLDKHQNWEDCCILESPRQLNDPAAVGAMFQKLGIPTHSPTPWIVGDKNANAQPSTYTPAHEAQWIDVLERIAIEYLKVFRRPCYDAIECRGMELLRNVLANRQNT